MLLKIWQNSLENNCVRVHFVIRLQAGRHVFFSEFCQSLKNTYFVEHLPKTASVICLTVNNKVELNYAIKTNEMVKHDENLFTDDNFYDILRIHIQF